MSALIDFDRFVEIEKKFTIERNIYARANIHGHLEGYNGIIQTILSIVKGRPGENEKRLLLL